MQMILTELIVTTILLAEVVHCSSILLDWSSDVPVDETFQNFLVEYTPAVGEPPSFSKFSPTTMAVIIKNALSSIQYNATISIIKSDGSVVRIAKKYNIENHPDSPRLESITTTDTEAVISFMPPEGKNLTFYIKYYPIDHIEYANVIETKATVVKLQGLKPETKFSLQIFSMENSVLSMDSVESLFQTKDPEDYEILNTVPTLPIDFTLPFEQTISSAENATSTFSQTTKWPSVFTSTEITTSVAKDIERSTETGMAFPLIPAGKILGLTSPEPLTNELLTEIQSNTDSISTTSFNELMIHSTSQTTVGSFSASISGKQYLVSDAVTPVDVEDYVQTTTPLSPPLKIVHSTTHRPATLKTISKPEIDLSLFPEPTGDIYLSKEANNIRVEWDIPEDTVCDAFLLKYTILSLSTPKTYSVGTAAQETIIKMFPDHKLEFCVFCLLEGSTSQTWWARRIVDLSRPEPVSNIKVVEAVTDEFYISKIIVDWDWPVKEHDFEAYRIVVSYAKEKNMNGKQDIDVENVGPVTIEKLDPTQLYVITVRNISRELGISSQAKGIRQITPPVITSTLYPGQISSTAININFGESDPEYKFDHYDLIFSGNSKNISKILEKNDQKSFTFTRLIPGKTYGFELYTVYKGIRSRAVIANITTYPLKVDKLFPVIGKDYVVLYWDVQNFVNSDCRFRLSYIGTSNSGHHSSETVELNNTNKYRFDDLESETYYTFTITVIMGIGDAKAESESEMITVGISEADRMVPVVKRYGIRELAVTFSNDQNAFADTNGVIDNYAIIVTEDIKLNGDDYELKSWFEVRDEEHWPPYRASPSDYNPFRKQRSSNSVTFIIGAEDCERRRLDEQYCNGMLRANVDYFVRIRSYSVSNIAMETEWVSIKDVASSNEETSDGGRRLPCHMYLNGCPRKNGSRRWNRSDRVQILLSTSTFLMVLRLLW